MIKQIKY